MYARMALLLQSSCNRWLFAACLLGANSAGANAATFWELTNDTWYSTSATDVSFDGHSILAYKTPSNLTSPGDGIWRPTENSFDLLPTSGGFSWAATAIAPDGNGYVLTTVSAGPVYQTEWVGGGLNTVLRPLAPGRRAFGVQIFADGSGVIGNGESADGFWGEGIVWDVNGEPTSLSAATGFAEMSEALAASHDGSIIVGGSGRVAAVWDADRQLTRLGTLPGDDSSYGTNVSADGSIVIGVSVTYPAFSTPFRWTEAGGMESLGRFGGLQVTLARDISADGKTIIGNGIKADGRGIALIKSENKPWRDLKEYLESRHGLADQLAGWRLDEARAISGDGKTIVGWGFKPNGYVRGWAVTIPEPDSLSLLVAGLAASFAAIATQMRRRGRERQP